MTVSFRRRISAEDGISSAAAFLQQIGADSIDLLFDVRFVDRYDGRARQAWQQALLPRRKQLRSLTVVSHSTLTRMGATVFGMVLGIECVILRDLPGS